MNETILRRGPNLFSSSLTSTLRNWSGIQARAASQQPGKDLRLYDMEGCPFCRLVREALTELDIDAEIYPCPKGGGLYRAEVIEMGGKAMFPFLVDPNTGVQMYESLDIIAYLYKTYGQRPLPLKWRLGALQKAGSMIAGTARPGRGLRKQPSQAPEQLLELYSFEASPFARPVREMLCELEIPYIVRNCGRSKSSEWVPPPVRDTLNIQPDSELKNRKVLQETKGRVSIPYLSDPNTGKDMFESSAILSYLKSTYAE